MQFSSVLPPWADPRAWSVLGDRWLETGDPRGEMVACGLAGTPVPERLLASRLRGDRGWDLQDVVLARAADAHPEQLKVAWRFGFAHSVVVEDGVTPAEPLLKTLAEAPAGRFIDSLILGTTWADDRPLDALGPAGTVGWALPLLETQPFAHLRSLQLGPDTVPGDRFRGREFRLEMSNWTLGSPKKVAPPPDRLGPDLTRAVSVPTLETLRLYGECLALEPLSLPKLQELDVQARFVPWPTVEALVRSALPSLNRLNLWLGHAAEDQRHKASFVDLYGPPGDEDALIPLWAGAFPNLEHLAVVHQPHALFQSAGNAQCLKTLRTLSLTDGLMADEDVPAKLAARFSHLERLDLSRNSLTQEHVSGLTTALPALIAEPGKPPEPDLVMSLFSL